MNHNIIYYKRSLIFSIIMTILMLLVFSPLLVLIFTEGGDKEYIGVYIVLVLGPFLGMTIYYLYKYCYYKKVELKYIQEVKLEKLTPGFNHCSSFVINMNINREMKKVETLAIYRSGWNALLHFQVDDYVGEIVKVGYDEINEVCVIIEKISNNDFCGE